MKKTLIIGSLLVFTKITTAQNTFPTGVGTYAGIGTTTPADNLDIKAGNSNGGIHISQSGNTGALLRMTSLTGDYALYTTGTGNTGSGLSGMGGEFALYDYLGGTHPFIIKGGNTGLGASPLSSAKLNVVGNAIAVRGYASGNTTQNFGGWFES